MFDLKRTKGTNEAKHHFRYVELLTGIEEVSQVNTLPSFRADAGKALVVFSLPTHSSIFTWSGAAGCKQGLTVFT